MFTQTTTRNASPRGFTLVELLAAMAILAVLAAISLSAVQQVEVQARIERTKAMIARLDRLVMEKYEGYRTRKVPLRLAANLTPKQAATIRLNAIHELMRAELPDRISDLCTDAELSDLQSGDSSLNTILDVNNVKLANLSTSPAVTLPATPSVAKAYKTKAKQLMTQSGKPWSTTFENAECLYLIVSAMRDDNSAAIDFFTAREIQNVDDDAIPEFIDAWGQPISFLRWAPGYTSAVAITTQVADRTVAPDPFDPMHADNRWLSTPNVDNCFALKPLIYSGGPDRKTDINVGSLSAFIYANTTPPSDPYVTASPLVGAPTDFNSDGLNHKDNLTNHYIEVR